MHDERIVLIWLGFRQHPGPARQPGSASLPPQSLGRTHAPRVESSVLYSVFFDTPWLSTHAPLPSPPPPFHSLFLKRPPEGVTDENAVYVERSAVPMNPHGWTTFRQVGCFSRQEQEEGEQRHRDNYHHSHGRSLTLLHQEDKLPFHHQRETDAETSSYYPHDTHPHNRRLSAAGPGPVRLLGHDRTPEGCAAHCATKMGGGIGFFGIGFGDE